MARDSWASRFGFVMATAGFAVGLGNIWRFPYLAGMNGGGAFLLVYVAIAVVIGIPLLTAEIGLGRRAQLSPLAGMVRLTGSRTSPWNAIGVLGVTAAVLIQCYYVMLIGWIAGYFVMIVSGRLAGASPESLAATFARFTSTPAPVVGYTLLVVLSMALVVARGLRGGLERLSSLAMPLLFVLLIALAVRSLTFPGALEGLRWYLAPDLSALSPGMVLAALGQAFYSIGIGMAAAFCFGSYLQSHSSDVPGNAALVVVFDTAVAFLAGLVIFPALFAFGLEPDAGPGLLFMTMTSLFAEMPAGRLFGAAFFLLLILAAMTSAAALHEALTVTVTDATGTRRRPTSWAVAAATFALSVPIILSQGPWSDLRVLGMDLFGLADTVSGNVLLPAGAFLLSLYTAFVWGFERFREETNAGAGAVRIGRFWKPFVVGLIPVAVAIVWLAGLGVGS